MSPFNFIPLYNQTIQDDAAFLAGFVARNDLAQFLLQQLRQRTFDEPFAAQLVVGQRGMGKTSLLRRVAIGVAEDEELQKRFIPLRFREEQYNVLTLADFWRNCAESLAEWCETNAAGSQFPRFFDNQSESREWRDPDVVLTAFVDETRALGARPLLLVDNLDLIVDAIPPHESWALRRTLQAPGGPALIGAATQVLKQTADRESAFYEFFRLHLLQPLSADELIVCLRRLAQARGEAGRRVAQIVDAEPQRLRALHPFTGGNPRVLALIYRLLESETTHQALDDLEALLDNLTAYYKGRVEEYQTPLQRKVIDALALNWDPITSHDLSAVTDVDVTTISSQLSRLRNNGLIEEVELAGARAGYQMVERLFNIWYLMRHGTRRTRQRVSWLTKFLVLFYPADDLRRMWLAADDAPREAKRPLLDYREALAGAIEAVEQRTAASQFGVGVSLSAGGEDPEDEAAAFARAILRLVEESRYPEVLAAIEKHLPIVQVQADEPSRIAVAGMLVLKGYALAVAGENEKAVAVYDDVIARFGAASEAALREPVATGLVYKGVALAALGRSQEAVLVYDDVVARFRDASEAALRELVATALVNKGVALGALGRSQEAIDVYDDVVARFGAVSETTLHRPVATALGNKGVTLGALGHSQEAIDVYDDIVARFGAASEATLREQVATALFNKGFTLGALGRSQEAIDVYDDVVARFGAASEATLREQVAKALVSKGVVLRALGRSQGAIDVYDNMVARFGAASEATLREKVAWALCNKGVMLFALGRSQEAIDAFNDAVARFGAANEAALRKIVSRALYIKGYLLAHSQGLLVEAAQAYRESLAFEWVPPEFAKFEFAWLLLMTGEAAEAAALRQSLADAPAVSLRLLEAGLEMAADNFGAAAAHFDEALAADAGAAQSDRLGELMWFLRLAHTRGYGEKLIAHFESAGHAERLAPIYAALVALVRGERQLLNVNPETREPAKVIYERLVAPLRRNEPAPTKKAGARRGRPPKRRGR